METYADGLLERISLESFKFNLRGWKEPAAGFFAPSPARKQVLSERSRWLSQHAERHLVYLPSAADLVRESVDLARILDAAFMPAGSAALTDQLKGLGEQWECDLILCRKDSLGCMRMEAGVVCFPSAWAPEEKLGLPVFAVHAPVPGLNAAIGDKIEHLLNRLPAGNAWLRINWGLSTSPERNQHPLRRLPRLSSTTPIESIWLRLEHQALLRLPVTQGILFGIHLHSYSLAEVRSKPPVARAIAGQLRSMPADMLRYKGILDVKERVANWLD
jgi:hypothetical protein